MPLHHPNIGQIFLLFLSDDILPKEYRLLMRDVVGGHHGAYSWFDDWRSPYHLLQRDEPSEWNDFKARNIEDLGFDFSSEVGSTFIKLSSFSFNSGADWFYYPLRLDCL